MNINFMRYLDRWVGVPVCFVLSIFNLIIAFFSSIGIKKDFKVKRILFIKLSEMGAIVLSNPLLQKTKSDFPDAELYFLTFEKNKCVFDVLDNDVAPSNIFTIRGSSLILFFIDTLKVIVKIASLKVDVTFDLEMFSRFTAILTYLSGAKKRVGFYRYTLEGLYRGNLLTHRIQYNTSMHVSKIYLSMLQGLKQKSKKSSEMYSVVKDENAALGKYLPSEEAKKEFQDKLKGIGVAGGKRIFLVNPGEGVLPLREWPFDNFVNIAKRILENPDNCIIVVGASNSIKMQQLTETLSDSGRCFNMSGETSLKDLMCLFEASEALVSNDCGIAHLAALSNIKKFVFFGPETPKVFSPLGEDNYVFFSEFPCSPCLSALNHRASACRDNNCLKSITADAVYENIQKIV